MTWHMFFLFLHLSRKVQITHVVIDFFQRGAGLFHAFNCCCTELPMFLIGCFTFFCDLKIKWKWDSGLNYDNDKAKRHVKKCEQCCVTSCQQDLRLTKMHIPLILYSSLKVHYLKDLLLPLHLQHLTNIATWCTKINSSTS